MKTPQLLNYERDRWIAGDGNLSEIPSAIDGAPVAMTGSGGLDFGGMLRHAREVGGPALRKLTFHERARMIKALGLAIMARKEELYELNYLTGATRKDGRGLGLVSIEERGHAAGGEVLIVSQPGQGTTIFACVPAGEPVRVTSESYDWRPAGDSVEVAKKPQAPEPISDSTSR